MLVLSDSHSAYLASSLSTFHVTFPCIILGGGQSDWIGARHASQRMGALTPSFERFGRACGGQRFLAASHAGE